MSAGQDFSSARRRVLSHLPALQALLLGTSGCGGTAFTEEGAVPGLRLSASIDLGEACVDLIFDQGGVAVSERDGIVDEQSLTLLLSGALRVDAAFSAKPFRTLGTTAAWYVGTAAVRSRAATGVSFPAGATA